MSTEEVTIWIMFGLLGVIVIASMILGMMIEVLRSERKANEEYAKSRAPGKHAFGGMVTTPPTMTVSTKSVKELASDDTDD